MYLLVFTRIIFTFPPLEQQQGESTSVTHSTGQVVSLQQLERCTHCIPIQVLVGAMCSLLTVYR